MVEQKNITSGSSSFGRASAFQAEGGGFEPRLPLMSSANVAQSVEHIHGKDEVTSSILVIGSPESGSKEVLKLIELLLKNTSKS
jgi:hypothetical protein